MGPFTYTGRSKDRERPDIVIGHKSVHSSNNCDALDEGNGAKIKEIVEAASSGDWIGIKGHPTAVYDLGSAGGPTTSIMVPNEVRISGNGWGTTIRNRPDGNQQVFRAESVTWGTILEHMRFLATLPTGAGTGQSQLINYNGSDFVLRGLKVLWDTGFTPTEAADLVLRFAISGNGGSIIECFVEETPILSTLLGGGQELYGIYGAFVHRCRSDDGDIGFRIGSGGNASGLVTNNSAVAGVRMLTDTNLNGGEIHVAAGAHGVDAIGSFGALISGVEMIGGAGGVGIEMGTNTRAIGNEINSFDEGILTTQPNSIIKANHLSGCGVQAIHVKTGDDDSTVVGNVLHAGSGANAEGVRVDANRCTIEANPITVTGTCLEITGNGNRAAGNVYVGANRVVNSGDDNHILDDGLMLEGALGDVHVAGSSTRLMWIPSKFAFRAGNVNGDHWDEANIGDYSAALGRRVRASGNSSVALGDLCEAAGDYSMAVMNACEALAAFSYASGREAVANHIGEHAQSGRSIADSGDAQTSTYLQRRTTSDATQSELTVDGGAPSGSVITTANRFIMEDDHAYQFNVMVVARRTDADDESAAYEFKGVADRNAGVSALVGSVSKEVIAEDTAAWDVDVEVDAANNSIRVLVTGEGSKTINWLAFWRIVKLRGLD